MDRISPIKIDKKVIDTLTDEEVEIIRCSCENERDLAIVDILSGSGMRVSELCRLNIEDVNLEAGTMKVFGKGSKERICFLTGRAKIHLKWYLDTRVDDNPALFVTAKAPYMRLSRNGVEFIVKHLGEITGISDINRKCHPHKFRATLATNMINKGADVSDVQAILGLFRIRMWPSWLERVS
jgi:site-specific recombinase XerD